MKITYLATMLLLLVVPAKADELHLTSGVVLTNIYITKDDGGFVYYQTSIDSIGTKGKALLPVPKGEVAFAIKSQVTGRSESIVGKSETEGSIMPMTKPFYNPDGDVAFLTVGGSILLSSATVMNTDVTGNGFGLSAGLGIPLNRITLFPAVGYRSMEETSNTELGLAVRIYFK